MATLVNGEFDTLEKRPRVTALAPGSQNWHEFPISAGVPAFFASARGAYLVDAEGRELVDLYCGSGTVILGHADPYQLSVVRRALDNGATVSLRHPMELELAEKLVGLCPGADHTAFFKTGSEAVHAAIGTAVRATGRRALLTTTYHGWLMPLGELGGLSGIEVVPLDWDSPTLIADARRRATSAACLLVSPTPDMPPAETVRALVDAVREAGALVIFDEVKSAFRWAYPTAGEKLGTRPDMTVVSKAMANGFPISALLGGTELLGSTESFSVFSTYASEIVSIAGALACLDRLADGAYEAFSRNSTTLHEVLTDTCKPFDVGLRGVPTFFRLDLPESISSDDVCRGLFRRGVLYHPLDQVLVTAAHGDKEIDLVRTAVHETLKELTE